jgi:hypothetical protein
MTINELAKFIEEHKGKSLHSYYGNSFIVHSHVRQVYHQHVHITDDHILECCLKGTSYDEFIAMCEPFAIADTEKFLKAKSSPPAKGRTRRRFK